MSKILLYLFLFILFISSCSPKNIDINKNIVVISDTPGAGKIVKNHYKITLNYIGTLEDGTEFDNSYNKNQPFKFQFGLRQVIEGLEIGLKDMKVGGKKTIKIPPNLAYGKTGIKDLIPPNSSLIFFIELLDVEPHSYYVISEDVLYNFKNQKILQLINAKLIKIDIRSKKDISINGSINNSYHIEAFTNQGNLNPNFLKKYKSLVKENNHVVLISQEGEISAILANGLTENLGMRNIYSLKGGINRWIKKGYAIIK